MIIYVKPWLQHYGILFHSVGAKNLSLNISKMKELVVEFRRQQVSRHLLLKKINREAVVSLQHQIPDNLNITEDLPWTPKKIQSEA